MKALGICINQNIKNHFDKIIENIEWDLWPTLPEFICNEEGLYDGQYHAIVVGDATEGGHFVEVGQVCRSQCPRTPILAVYENEMPRSEQQLRKNGYDGCYNGQLETERLRNIILQCSSENIQQRSYVQIKSSEIFPDTQLNFNTYVYLPINKRHFRYSKANMPISKSKVSKLHESGVGHLFIRSKDADAFFSYLTQNLRALSQSVSASEKAKYQDLLSSFTDDMQKLISTKAESENYKLMYAAMSRYQKLTSCLITNDTDVNWYNRKFHELHQRLTDYWPVTTKSILASLQALSRGTQTGLERVADEAFSGVR